MIVFPAIDLKDGACVRLEEGDMDRDTKFNDDPADQARQFLSQGFDWLHVVDLNGAFAGRPVNSDAVASIRAATSAKMQLGGGIRTMAQIDHWLDLGIDRVILGTAALKDPELVKKGCASHPGRIVVGIDAKDGFVATEGWAETGTIAVAELAARFADCGVAAIVFTDIGRDGLLKGVNVEATAELMKSTNIPVIASGGVAGVEDLHALAKVEHLGLEGVISGRALYDGRLTASAAITFTTGLASAGRDSQEMA